MGHTVLVNFQGFDAVANQVCHPLHRLVSCPVCLSLILSNHVMCKSLTRLSAVLSCDVCLLLVFQPFNHEICVCHSSTRLLALQSCNMCNSDTYLQEIKGTKANMYELELKEDHKEPWKSFTKAISGGMGQVDTCNQN